VIPWGGSIYIVHYVDVFVAGSADCFVLKSIFESSLVLLAGIGFIESIPQLLS
jgi:hypothetical protein